MNFFKRIEISHWCGLISAIVCGLVVVGPNLFFMHSPEYRGIPIYGTDYENYYVARLNAAYVGCSFNCNPFEAHSAALFFDASVAEPILALPGIIAHIPAAYLTVVYEFLLPAILTLLYYLSLYRVTKSRAWAVTGSVLIMLGYTLFNSVDLINISDLIDLFHMHSVHTDFLLYSRPINPQFSSIIFLLYVNVLISYLRSRRTLLLVLLSVISGAAFYLYFFTCTYLFVVNVLVVLYLLYKKLFHDAGEYVMAILLSLVLGIPMFLNWYLLVHNKSYADLPHNGIISTHMASITPVGVLLFIFLGIGSYVYARTQDVRSDFVVLVILCSAVFIALNQQILSGIVLQPFHYQWYYGSPALVFILCYMGSHYVPAAHRLGKNFILGIIGLVILSNAVVIQYTSYNYWLSYTVSIQKYATTLEWVNTHIPEGSTIHTSGTLTSLIPIFTHDFVPNAPSANLYITTPESLGITQHEYILPTQ